MHIAQRAFVRLWNLLIQRLNCATGTGRASACATVFFVELAAFMAMWRYGGEHYVGMAPNGIASGYYPLGILRLVAAEPMSIGVQQLLVKIGLVATSLAAVGIFFRFSNAVSLICGLLSYGALEAFSPGWRHGCNVTFLAQIGLLFLPARSSELLGAQVLRLLRGGIGVVKAPCTYPTLVFVPTLIALTYGSAAFYKLKNGGLSLAWALSDNLRSILAIRYFESSFPEHLRFVTEHAFAWKAMALGNLVAQAAPLAIVVFGLGSWWRLLAALLYLAESLGLGIVMNFWNWHYLPLAAAFVDWDPLVNLVRRHLASTDRASVATSLIPPRWSVGAVTLGCLAVSFQAFLGFNPNHRLGYGANTYPFSSFEMYSGINVKAPYDEHQPQDIVKPEVQFNCKGSRPVRKVDRAAVKSINLEALAAKDADAVAATGRLLTTLGSQACGGQLLEATVARVTYRIPAYPEKIAYPVVSRELLATVKGDAGL